MIWNIDQTFSVWPYDFHFSLTSTSNTQPGSPLPFFLHFILSRDVLELSSLFNSCVLFLKCVELQGKMVTSTQFSNTPSVYSTSDDETQDCHQAESEQCSRYNTALLITWVSSLSQ